MDDDDDDDDDAGCYNVVHFHLSLLVMSGGVARPLPVSGGQGPPGCSPRGSREETCFYWKHAQEMKDAQIFGTLAAF